MKKPSLTFILVFTLAGLSFAQTPGTVRYPTNLDTGVSLFEAANRSTSTLNGGITGSDTSLTLTNAATFPNSGAVTINAEIVYYTGKSGNQLTGLLRGQCSTTASSQSNGSVVRGNIVSCHHNAIRDAIIAAQTKVGSGSSTPTANTFLQGNGSGTSAWLPLTGTTNTSFGVATGTAKSGNTLPLLFSSDANKPGLRWNGTTNTMQFSHDGTTWTDIGGSTAGIFGSGSTGFLPKFTGVSSIGNSILSESGSVVTASGSFRASTRLAAGSTSSTGSSFTTANFAENFTDGSASVVGQSNTFNLTAGSASSANHFGSQTNMTTQGSQNYTGIGFGGNFNFFHSGSGSLLAGVGVEGKALKTSTGPVTVLGGVTGNVTTSGTGAVTDAIGVNATATLDGGTVTNWYGFKTGDPGGAGPVTNAYGLHFSGITRGTNNYLIYSTCSDCQSVLGSVSIGTAGGTFLKKHGSSSTTWDPASIADGSMTSTTVTVTQAVVGDPCIAGFSVAVPAGALLTCNVTALSTLTVTLFNKTGSTLDLASGTLRASFFQY